MTTVHVLGAGSTPVGRLELSLRQMILDASKELYSNLNEDILPDLILVSNMSAPQFTNQNHLGAFTADILGLSDTPAMRIEAACGSGGAAVHQAFTAIKSGLYDIVLVIGVEKMTNASTPKATHCMAGAADFDCEIAPGVTFPGLNALIARRYMHEYGVTSEDLLQFSIYSHKHAVTNPKAMFRKEITMEKALNSRMVADPLRVFDCSPVSDGAAAILVVSDTIRKKYSHFEACEIVGSRVATDAIGLQDRKSLCELRASKIASKQAFKDAGITWKNIKAFEVHDAFSIMNALSIESFGIIGAGQARVLAQEGQIALDGDVPVNTFGGLKARGHPVGATGVYQVMENYLQLTGQAGKNQVDNIEYALSQNIGGSGATIPVNVCKRE
ncbi:MAG: thiolase domain-containing protein [Candidatus Hodarchaeales archaeon]